MATGTGESLPKTSGWKVISDNETIRQADNGQFAPGHLITFTTGKGGQGSVFVPNTAYNATNVRRLIDERVAVMDEVADLNG